MGSTSDTKQSLGSGNTTASTLSENKASQTPATLLPFFLHCHRCKIAQDSSEQKLLLFKTKGFDFFKVSEAIS